MASRIWKTLSRKRFDECQDSKSELARVLGLFDLTALGVGSTLGLGVYVLAGSVAKETAGPAVCISFLIAAIASAFAGMCYAEFASRVPKAGSAYVYSYVTVGEFVAFIIGWNLILEYVIGTASVARGLSNYLDALIGNQISQGLQSAMPIHVSFLSEYPDFFAFGVVMLLIILLCVGVRESSMLNNIFTVVNLITIVTIVVAGSLKADPANWRIRPEDIPDDMKEQAGSGGFMPFGISGVMMGAAKCFFGFVGFDAVATTGEEAKNPQRNIPIAIVVSLIIILIAYFSISTVLTMMWPYYDQNADAPFPFVFDKIGWPTIKWIVNIGAAFALCTSIFGGMFPLPRILYAMGSDGLIFKQLAKVHRKTMTPIIGTVASGLFTAFMSLIFNLQQLIDMMSIGTLLAYTIVAVSVLILRYQGKEYVSNNAVTSISDYQLTPLGVLKQIVNLQNQKDITEMSSKVAKYSVGVLCIVTFVIALFLSIVGDNAFGNNTLESVILIVLVFILLLNLVVIARQPTQDIDLAFKVPLVPLLPCCSIFINLYLMMQLDAFTWIRFSIWLLIGFAIYFFYGISHSEQGKRDKVEAEMIKRKYAEQIRIVTKF